MMHQPLLRVKLLLLPKKTSKEHPAPREGARGIRVSRQQDSKVRLIIGFELRH
jgi:hypothetical protein